MRWNEFINPRAFAELAVFLKEYQNRCGEVRQGSLVASEFTFQTSPTAVRFEQRPKRRSLLRKLVGPSLRDVLVSLLRGVIDRLIRAPLGNLPVQDFEELPGGISYPIFPGKA